MSDTVTIALIGAVATVVGGIAGAIAGYLLSELGTNRRQKREREDMNRSVRALVEIEIDHNLTSLERTIQEVEKQTQRESDREDEWGRFLVRAWLNDWTVSAWEGQLGLISTAFTPPKIREITAHYRFMSQIQQMVNLIEQTPGTYYQYELYGKALSLAKQCLQLKNPAAR